MKNKCLVGFVLLFGLAGSAMSAEKTGEAARAWLQKLYSTTPAAFIENSGQIADPTVRYIFRGSGLNIFHTTNGHVFQLFGREKLAHEGNQALDEGAEFRGARRHPLTDRKDFIIRSHAFSIKFVGAKQVEPTGLDKQQTKVNYFMGSDPNGWHRNVATYSKVAYRQLYDGIDLYTFGRRSYLKYEFHVAPGADYTQIIIAYEGIDGLTIDADGALHIRTPLGELVDEAPHIYQIIDGQHVQISGRYRLIDEKSCTFEIAGGIDPKTELVIDPHLAWSTFLGGTGADLAWDIAVDLNDGALLLTGASNSSPFPGAGSPSGGYDVFVTKVSSSGDELIWSTFLGDSNDDEGYGVAVDVNSNVLVTGATASGGFPAMGGAYDTSYNGKIDAFVTKLDSSGSLVWSTFLGGGNDDIAYDIGVDLAGNPCVTGGTDSSTFPSLFTPQAGTIDAFVTKFSAMPPPIYHWKHMTYSNVLGGNGDDIGRAIAVTPLGNAVVAGCTTSTYNFGRLSGSSYSGKWDAFVTEVYPHNVNLAGVWSCWLGGSDDDKGYGVDVGVDDEGPYVMVTGSTKSCDFPASGGFDNSYCGLSDAFVARLNYSATEDPCNLEQPALVSLAWASYLGGSVNDVGYDIVISDINQLSNPDLEDYVLLTGYTSSYNFPTPEGFDPYHNGWDDVFVTGVTASGHLVWSSYLGGSENDRGYGIAMGLNGNAFLAGETNSDDFPTMWCDAYDCTYNGAADCFVAKVGMDETIGFGKLYGTVWDANGNPIQGADVTVPGQLLPTQTDANGQFSFDSDPNTGDPNTRDVFAGQTTVTVTKTDPNYYPVTKVVTIDVNSTTRVNIQMTEEIQSLLTDPRVVDVRAKYCGPGKQTPYYMYGPWLCEKFMATIDWGNCEPNRVEWTTRVGAVYSDSLSSSTLGGVGVGGSITNHGRCFDMGGPDFGPGHGWVEVVAIGYRLGQGERPSPAKRVSFFDVIAAPPYVKDASDTNEVIVVFTGNGFEYRVLALPDFNLATWDSNNVDDADFPIFGGQGMNTGLDFEDEPGDCGSRLSAKVNMDGTSFVFTKGCDGRTKKEVHKEVPVAGIDLPKIRDVDVEAYATADFFFGCEGLCMTPEDWIAGGTLNLGCLFTYQTPPVYHPPLAGIPTYTRIALSLDLGLSSTLTQRGWINDGPELESNFFFEPLAKGILGAGIADVACVQGYVGGGFHSEITLYPPPIDWGDHYIVLVGGVEVIIGPWSREWGLEYDWWPNPGAHKTAINLNQLLRSNDFKLLSPDYLYEEGPLVLGGNEDVIKSTVFPYCVPEVVRTDGGILGSDMLAVWIDYDPSRGACNATELRYARYDGSNWTLLTAAWDDNTADLNPQLISLGDGNAVCIWQDANAVLADCNNLQTFNKHLEIAVWKYNSTAQQWTNMVAEPNNWLTTDTYLDRSPKLAAANENDMMAVWIKNEDCNTWGDASTAANKIMWSRYNSGVWDGPNTIASGLGAILGTTLAYDGNTATYVFCVDTNDDFNTSEDQELWITRYYDVNEGWDAPNQLTNDSITDAAPRLAYDPDGNLLLFWVRGNDICVAEEANFPNLLSLPDISSKKVASPGESMGSKDFDLVMGDQGQIAVVWSDVSVPYYSKRLDPDHFDPNRIDPNRIDPNDDLYRIPTPNEPNRVRVGYDIWVSYRDPCFGLWSEPRQLTWDDAAERFVSGVFEPNGTLLCVYNKRQTEYYTVDYNDPCDSEPNHHIVHVRNVPNAGRSDLVYLRDGLKCDLSIDIEDVTLVPPNPMPGEAEIFANVKNLGVSPASNIQVLFSDGSAGGGTWSPNSTRTIVDPLVGGEANEVSVWWTVPRSIFPRTISVGIVSYQSQQNDLNSGNNSVSFEVLAPDLTISEMTVDVAGPNYVVTMRVANEGVLPAYDMNDQVKVVLRRDDPNGEIGQMGNILRKTAIQIIEPMTYHDVQFTLSPEESNGIERVYGIVDEPNYQPKGDVYEFNEDNNIRSVRLMYWSAYLRGDLDGDGDVDFCDFAIFAAAWQSEEGDGNWNPACNLWCPQDDIIDWKDLRFWVISWLHSK